MKKKVIILTVGLGLLGFGGMFALAWFTQSAPPVQSAPTTQATSSEVVPPTPQATEAMTASQKLASMSGRTGQQLSEKELETLVYEIREKIKEYDQKLADLQTREKRFQLAQEDLNKEIQEMADLRVELASAVASLKSEQQKLLQSRIEVESDEQKNLASIAATYDKMDSESASKILMNMVKNQNVGNSTDDAVKILYYMEDRTKAKVLAAMAEAEPAVSAFICQRLKRMVTKD